MSESIKKEILDTIKKYDSIVIGRHIRPDGDAIGSAKGLGRIIKLSFPDKKVYVASSDSSEYLEFLGPDDGEVPLDIISSSLVILLDTATSNRVSYPMLLKGREMVKIDHHIKCEDFAGLEWIESAYSSTCEMISEFYETFRPELKLDREGAEAIYTGLVTDSGRFLYSSTSPHTLRMAALMLDYGFDIERLEAYIELKPYDFFRYRTALFERIHVTDNGLAWVYVDSDFQKKWNLSREDASESVTFMSEIKGSICYIAFIDNPDGTIRVRLRSRFMTVVDIASRYSGGGHDRASGATCYSKDEMNSLIKDADESVKRYKESHNGWM